MPRARRIRQRRGESVGSALADFDQRIERAHQNAADNGQPDAFPGGRSFGVGIRLIPGTAADGERPVGDSVRDDGAHNQGDANEQQIRIPCGLTMYSR